MFENPSTSTNSFRIGSIFLRCSVDSLCFFFSDLFLAFSLEKDSFHLKKET